MFLGSNWGLVRSNYRPSLLYRGVSDSRVSQIPIFMFEKDPPNDLGYFGLELRARSSEWRKRVVRVRG